MTRQWAPGDVVSALLDGNEIVGLVRGGGQYVYYADSVTTDHVAMKHLRNVRPLVVIDPEDREQVEALARLIRHCHSPERCGQPGLCATKRLTDALREFANPKPIKPAEPLGLGAVVEDANGVRWVRDAERHDCWFSAPANAVSRRQSWADTDAVRVLSEGVTP